MSSSRCVTQKGASLTFKTPYGYIVMLTRAKVKEQIYEKTSRMILSGALAWQ
jgi:hypothetical protein